MTQNYSALLSVRRVYDAVTTPENRMPASVRVQP